MTDTTEKATLDAPDDIALAERLQKGREEIMAELRKLIVGQEDVIELVLLSLFVGGNSLIVGVPGLAKIGPCMNTIFRRPVLGSS